MIADDALLARRQVFDQYTRYLDGLRANDVDAVLATLHDGVASAVRDYVDDTGTLVELSGRSAHRSWYQALFEKYEIQSVQPLCQVIEDWYVFSELRITAAPRNGRRGRRLPYRGVPRAGQGRTVHRPHRPRH